MEQNNVVQEFIDKVLKGESLEQTARHEAGHRLMWMATGDRQTKYAICNGHPCVIPEDGITDNIKVKELSSKDAGAMLLVKLGGVVSEMVGLGLDAHIDPIAGFIAQDYMAAKPVIDWDDDAENGGDIPQACTIIGEIAGYGEIPIRENLRNAMAVIAKAMHENEEEYEAEIREATEFLKAHDGEWTL